MVMVVVVVMLDAGRESSRIYMPNKGGQPLRDCVICGPASRAVGDEVSKPAHETRLTTNPYATRMIWGKAF